MNISSIPARHHGWLAHLIVLAIIAIPLFGHLDTIPLQTHDEMRQAVNATEINTSGDLLAITFEHKPEFWNTKPPLLVWIQALFLRVFGYSETTIRLPVAISAGLLCLLMLRFLKRRTGCWLPGIIASGILVTSIGFVCAHSARTGDYDVPLTLCLTASLFWLADWVEDGRPHRLYMAGIALIAAVLTKGIAGFFFCPFMLVYILMHKKGKSLLRSPALYISLAGFVILVGGYYLLREERQPGYFHAVMQNEVGGRYTSSIEGHDGTIWNYITVLTERGLRPWNYLIIPAIIAAFFVRDDRQRRLAALCGLTALSLFIILSSSSTKIHWYLVPAYPLLSVLCALFLWQICQLLRQYEPAESVWRLNFLPLIFLLIIGMPPYLEMTNAILDSHIEGNAEDAKRYIKEAFLGRRAMVASAYCGDTYPVIWYREVLELKGIVLPVVHRDSLAAGTKVMVWEKELKEYIARQYVASEVDYLGDMQVFLIGDRRLNPTDSDIPAQAFPESPSK